MAGRKSYKTLLLEAQKLKGESGVNAHKRAGLLVKVFEDRDFRAEIGQLDDFAAADILDAEVEDLCLTFLQLKAMYETFPDAADWKDGNLATLYNRTLEAGMPEPEDRPARRRNGVTVKQYKELESEKDDIQAQLNYTKKTLVSTQDDVDRLRAENAELRNENQRLQGRVEELERLLKPQLATA